MEFENQAEIENNAEPMNIENDNAESPQVFNALNIKMLSEKKIGYARPFMPDLPPEGSTLGAAFRRENIIGSYINSIDFKDFDKPELMVENYDYKEHIPIDLFDKFGWQYASTLNPDHAEALTKQIRGEELDAAIMHNAPWRSFLSSMVANMVDPTILLPGGTIYKNTRAAQGAAKSALSVGLASVAGAATQEVLLHQTQVTRELDESMFNVIGAGFVGSVVGGLAGAYVGGAIFNKAKKEVVESLASDNPIGPTMTMQQSISAQKVRDPAYEKEINSLYGGTPSAAVGKFLGYVTQSLTPQGRLHFSPFPSSRAVANELPEHNLIINANLPGTRKVMGPDGKEVEVPREAIESPISVESEIKQMKRGMFKHLIDYQDIFYKQAGLGGPLKSLKSTLGKHEGLSFGDFEKAVWREVVTGEKNVNQSVNQASDLVINRFFEPIKEEYIKLGIFSPDIDVKTAANYFMRVYNKDKIRDPVQRAQTKGKFQAYIQKTNEELTELQPYIETLQGDIKAVEKEVYGEIVQKRVAEVKEKFLKREAEVKAFLEKDKAKLEKNIEILEAEIRHFEETKNPLIKKNPNAKKIKAVKEEISKLKTEFDKGASKKEKQIRALRKDGKHSLEVEKLKAKSEGRQKAKPEIANRLEKLEKELKELVPPHLYNSKGELRKVIDPDYYGVEADKIIDNILGMGQDDAFNPVMASLPTSKTNPLKERTFLMPDIELEDELITSFTEIAPMFINATAPNIGLLRYAKRLGMETDNEARGVKLKYLEEDYKAAVAAAPEKEAKLYKRYQRDKRDTLAMFDILKGVYGMGPNVLDSDAARFVKNLSTWNYTRLMGQITIQAFTDAGAIGLKHGLFRTIHSGLMPVLREMKNGGYDKEFLQDIGFVTNTLKGSRLKGMIDQDPTAGQKGLFTRGLDTFSEAYGNLTLMNQWTDAMQFIAGKTSMARTLRAIDTWATTGTMPAKEANRLKNLGLSEKNYSVIYDQFKKHGGKTQGSYWVNWGKWDVNNEALDALSQFKNITMQEVDHTVISGPGIGEKPLYARKGIGTLLFQFKGFSYAMTSKALIPGLQRGDSEFYQGLAMLGSLSLMGYMTSALIRGDEPDMSYDNLFKEMIDRSGITGVFGNVYNTGNKLGLIPGKEVSRYKTRGLFSTLGGPSVGLIEDNIALLSKLVHADTTNFNTNDMYKFMRNWPGQNYAFTHRLNKMIAKDFADYLGFEESE